YDLRRGALDPGVIVDKTRGETVMQGIRLDAVPSASGEWLFSLYIDGNNHPFVHALNLAQGWALCLDLPTGPHDFEPQLLWSLATWPVSSIALSPDGARLYADRGAIAGLDASTGRQLTELAGITNAGAIQQVDSQTTPTTHH